MEGPLFAGPIFTRELTICPRRKQFFIARTAYAAILLLLLCTAWLVVTGTQYIRDIGDSARFGATWFQIAGPLQVILAIFSSALIAAASVCQEKDKRTLDLLLVTDLSNTELVLGKLLSSLVTLFAAFVGGIPVYFFASLLGGISYGQIVRVTLVTFLALLGGGSLGTLIAFWREKTVQAITLTVMGVVLWLGIGELAGWIGQNAHLWGLREQSLAVAISPWRATLEAAKPILVEVPNLGLFRYDLSLFFLLNGGAIVLMNAIAIAGVRRWNVVRDPHRVIPEDTGEQMEADLQQLAATAGDQQSSLSVAEPGTDVNYPSGRTTLAELSQPDRKSRLARLHAAPGEAREVWDNPVLWRELRTWAYGRKILIVRLVYILLFCLAVLGLHFVGETPDGINSGAIAAISVPLLVLGLILVNAQAVISLTTERDGRTLDTLLVTDISPREFIFGKLLGTLYNTKEVLVLSTALCLWFWWRQWLRLEDTIYLIVGLWVLFSFVAMLGVHAGLNYVNSRHAIATSLGTVFFLFVGVAVCMRVMLAFSGSFQAQLHPFLAFMIGGGAGLYMALGVRNPSNAIALASFACPLATFYALTSLFLGQTHLVFVTIVAAYSFATAAMLIPAIDEFDVATGRTTLDEM
ncbi:MAG: ABC transporter permease subunit [Thermogutta sp.]